MLDFSCETPTLLRYQSINVGMDLIVWTDLENEYLGPPPAECSSDDSLNSVVERTYFLFTNQEEDVT